ncbi:OB-fold protein [Litoribaculum gwangyangense]|uniref:tRNA_anti-like n=1 Tax=Litoribaculum gwangyangense TaxID=1130722 RepID=A0ABP9CXF1_9FLAO
MKRKIPLFILSFSFILLALAIVIYNYTYKNHRDIKTEEVEFSLTSEEILNEFSINPTQSEKKYLNKTIEVTGTISEKTPTTITLDHIVFCQFSNEIKTVVENNSLLKIKGRFIGFDDLLSEIKLDQCFVK